MVIIPPADQKAAGSLPPYADRAATRTSADPIQPTSASHRGRILVVAPHEPAAPAPRGKGGVKGKPANPQETKSRECPLQPRMWSSPATHGRLQPRRRSP